MTARGAALAVTGSVLAHFAVLGGLALALAPTLPSDQPRPQTRINIAPQSVRQTTALPADSSGEAVTEKATHSPAARQGAVRETVASNSLISAQSLKPSVESGIVVGPSLLDLPLTPATAPIAPMAVASSQTVRVAVSAPSAPVVQPQSPSSKPLRIVVPDAFKIALTAPPATSSAPLTPTSAAATGADLPTRVATDRPLPVLSQTAALAWSGAGITTVSPESLAAIAAFSEQGDPTAAAQEVRDGISGILSSVPCARLQTVFNPDTGELELTGHIPEELHRAPVLDALRAEVGDAISVSDKLLILPRPQCNALAGIADVDLPQSTEQLTNPRVIGADGYAQNFIYGDGQRLELDLVGPDYDSFVYVDYFVADGSVIHLQPNIIVPLEKLASEAPLTVGRDRGEKPSVQLTIGPPFGQEIAVAFATSVPLYDGLRPAQEPAASYLAFLKVQVAAARARSPSFKGEWVYFFITTKAE